MRLSSSTHSTKLVVNYLSFLEKEKRRSSNTLVAVERDLRLLGANPEQLSFDELRTLLSKKRAAGMAASSLSRMASSWRGFYEYLVKGNMLPDNPAQALKTPKLQSRLPKTVSVDVLRAVLLKPLSADSFELARAQVLVELLYFTGLRVSEAISLRWVSPHASQPVKNNWVCLSRKEIQVLGKGNRERIIPLVDVFLSRLKQWQGYLNEKKIMTDYVLVSQKGKQITARQAQYDVVSFGRCFSVDCHLHPHMFRHSFGSHMLQESQNLRAVQELLGHRSLSSTQVYTALDFKHLAEVYDNTFPRSGKNN